MYRVNDVKEKATGRENKDGKRDQQTAIGRRQREDQGKG